ncbi:MAG TPA: 2OG-Fe(II) oxygenase [Pirellulaceae bacterium]|jgi:hypothetical protein
MESVRNSLEDLLKTLGESSQFISARSLPPVLPGLEVNDVGTIGTPISAADAKRLIAKATQAPYGRGEETIVDTNVRRVWQLEPSQFRLENREWDAQIAAIVEAASQDFGIQQKVRAELYRLLIYEPGSFFAPHRDTEKSEQMFATLVVCLPSRHTGDALIVRHDGQTRRIDFGSKEGQFKTQYAAFYADCEHEIEPVESGYRICLIYNLATVGERQPTAPQNAESVAKAAGLLRLLFGEPAIKDEPASELDKLAIPFAHEYSAAGLDPTQFKGADRARADVLRRAAASLGYSCHFALLTHWQSGTPDYSTIDFDPYQRRSSHRWSDDDDDEEEEDEDSGDDSEAEMEEVFDESLSLDHWLDEQGNVEPFGEIQLQDDEILTLTSREGWSRKQTISEATGNAGASMERWYRQGAIVIWPHDRTFRILAGEGQQAALPELEKRLSSSKTDADLAACRSFAQEIIKHWQPRQRGPSDNPAFPRRMLDVLLRIGTLELVETFLRDVLPKDFDGSEGKSLLAMGQKFGLAPLGPLLCVLIEQQKPTDYFTDLSTIVAVCRPLCCDAPSPADDRRKACRELADALMAAALRWDKGRREWRDSKDSRAEVVDGMVQILASISASRQLDAFVAHVLADPKNYDLHRALIPGVKAIYQWLSQVPEAGPAATALWEHCRAELRVATAHPIEPPADWKREAKLDCKCEDCQALARFLRKPGGVCRAIFDSPGSPATSPSTDQRAQARLHPRDRAERLAANARLHQNASFLRTSLAAIQTRPTTLGRIGRAGPRQSATSTAAFQKGEAQLKEIGQKGMSSSAISSSSALSGGGVAGRLEKSLKSLAQVLALCPQTVTCGGNIGQRAAKSVNDRTGQRERTIRVVRVDNVAEIVKIATQSIDERSLLRRLLQIHDQLRKIRADAKQPQFERESVGFLGHKAVLPNHVGVGVSSTRIFHTQPLTLLALSFEVSAELFVLALLCFPLLMSRVK